MAANLQGRLATKTEEPEVEATPSEQLGALPVEAPVEALGELPADGEDMGQTLAVSGDVDYEKAYADLKVEQAEQDKKDTLMDEQLKVEMEVEESWFGGAFVAEQDQDDGFFDNAWEVGATAANGAVEQVVRTFGDLIEGEEMSAIDIGRGYLALASMYITDKTGNDDAAAVGTLTDLAKGETVVGNTYDSAKELTEIATGTRLANLSDFETGLDISEPDSPAGKVGAEMLKWIAVFAATRKGLGTADTKLAGLGKSMTAGAVTDFTAFDPHEERLSDLMREYGKDNPVFDNAVTEYLSANSSDSNLEGRTKNAIEGLFVGATLDVTVAGVKQMWRGLKWLRGRKQTKAYEAAVPGKLGNLRGVADELGDVTDEAVEAEAKVAGKEAPKAEAPAAEAVEESVEEIVKKELKWNIKGKLGKEASEALARNIQEGNFDKVAELVNFNEARIDWESMSDPDAIKGLFNAFSDAASDMMDEATGGVVTHAASKAIGESVGFSLEGANGLFGDLKVNGGLTARMFAANQTMLASADHLQNLAKAVADNDSSANKLAFHQHIETHAALMATVKGSGTEIARALSGMRMMKDAMADSMAMFDELQVHGGRDTKKMVRDVLDHHTLDEVNAAISGYTTKSLSDYVTELAINGMLSSFKTHEVNLLSNAGMALILGPIERYSSVAISKFRKNPKMRREFREANAAMYAQFAATQKASKLAWQAAKDGLPVSDVRQRMEFANRKAWRFDANKHTGFLKVLAHAGNVFGKLIRLPGNALLMGDEFFKTIHKEAEVAAQSYRMASATTDKLGLKGKRHTDALNKEMKRLQKLMDEDPKKLAIKDPKASAERNKMEKAAIRHARRQTFQEDSETKLGGAVANALNANPYVKLFVAPFVKTPMNLMRQAFVDRTPLALMVDQNKAILRKGGPEADAVMARMLSGIGIAGTGLTMAQSGMITGSGENFNNTERLDKIPEYAIKIGGRYYQYNRLDPVGSIFGLMADLNTAINKYDPYDPRQMGMLEEYSQAVTLSVTKNVLNKTWTKSFNDIVEQAHRASTGGEGSAKRAAGRLIGDNLYKLMPYGSLVRSITQSIDPVVRDAWTIRDRVFKNLPGFSEDMPPVIDMLGREVTRQNAEWYWANPFGASLESTDPVDRELAGLEFDASILPKDVDGVQLDSRQYSELKRLIGDYGHGAPTLHEQLGTLFESQGYKDMPTEPMKIALIKRIIQSRKKIAKQFLKQQDDRKVFKGKMELKAYDIEQFTGSDMNKMREQLGIISK